MIYESDETRLFYTSLGDGPKVVLVHPTPVDHRFWLPLAAKLPGYHLLLPDLRGHGQSQLGGERMSITQLAGDMIELLDTREIERAWFVGCSIGGYVLFDLWRRVPERVAGLVFCCSKPQADGPAAKARRQETIAQIRSQGTEAFFDAMARSLVGSSARRRQPALVDQVRQMMALEPEAAIAVQQALAERPDSVATARTITVPTLVLAGGEDASATPAEADVAAHAVRRAEFHLIEDAGHFAAFEQPERVGALIRSFFDRASLRSG